MLIDFLLNNWETIAKMVGAAFLFLLGRKSRKVNYKEAEFLAYMKKLETYELEFSLKTDMLESLKKDYESRYVMMEKNLAKAVTQNHKSESIIKSLENTIAQYEQKFGTLEST